MQPDPGSFSLMFLFYLTHWLYARYLFHLSGYNKIAQVAPTWAKNFEVALFKLIMYVFQ